MRRHFGASASTGPTNVPPIGEMTAVRRLLPYLWPPGEWDIKARVVLALVCLVVAKVSIVVVPIFYKGAVDVLSAGTATAIALPIGLVLAYGGARTLSLAFAELRDAVFAKVGQRAIRQVALEVFRHLHALSLRFHLERQTGGLTRAIERGTKAISTLLSYSLFSILPTLFEILVVSMVLWWLYDWRFAAVTLVTISCYIVYTFTITEWRLRFRREMNDLDSRANTRAVDSLLNYETVKYFGNEDHEASRYDKALRRYETAAVRSQQSLSLLNIGQSFIISTGVVLVMLMAGQGIVDGERTIGDFVLVNTYMLQLYQPLNFFGVVYREIKQSLTDMETMFALLAVNREVQDDPGAPPLAISGGALVFDDVHFGYDPRRPILKGISFSVPPGRTVAIVGPSGAGKSTIGRLMFRFYDVDGGAIRIDGQDLRAVTQASLRGSIGIVPQDTVLFNDTIAYNIAYGRPGAAPEEVDRAAHLAELTGLIGRLPDGAQTTVGERGLKLSGGEKQRVAIARTILKNPPILLLDEATSALDTHTEREIQGNLKDISVGRTTLVIAHRLSTVIDADEILVLDDGRIVERGRHQDLLDHGGVYAALWRRQQEAARAQPATDQG
jgi:ATP-binding cassette, subfamily B, heavy metal transporter